MATVNCCHSSTPWCNLAFPVLHSTLRQRAAAPATGSPSAANCDEVFVANPNKPQDVKTILAKNRDKLVELLQNLSPGKGSEDEQFEEEKEFIISEIAKLSV